MTPLERGADLHMAQLMPLPLTVSCFIKIQIGLPFFYRLTLVVPEKGPLNGCVCVCVRVCVSVSVSVWSDDSTYTGFDHLTWLWLCTLCTGLPVQMLFSGSVMRSASAGNINFTGRGRDFDMSRSVWHWAASMRWNLACTVTILLAKFQRNVWGVEFKF